jgi:hypothetical protein
MRIQKNSFAFLSFTSENQEASEVFTCKAEFGGELGDDDKSGPCRCKSSSVMPCPAVQFPARSWLQRKHTNHNQTSVGSFNVNCKGRAGE